MAFEDRKPIHRVPYAGIIKLGVMVKPCSPDLFVDRVMVDDTSGKKIEFVTIKNDPKQGREWEVIRYSRNGEIAFIRIAKDQERKENLSFIKQAFKDGDKISYKDKPPYPTAVPWFVVDHLPEVVKIYGSRCDQLEIMCPSNDIEQVIPGLYKNMRGDMANCVGNGLTARRVDGNGVWNDLPYCNCGYRTGLPAKTVKASDLEIDSGSYCIVRSNDKAEKDVWRKVASRNADGIHLEELTPTCGPKPELRILLYECGGSVLSPYVIRSKNMKSYDYVSNALKMVKDGDEASRGLGYLMGIPFILKIRIEKSHLLENGKKIAKDDILLTVDFDTKYGNPLRSQLAEKERTAPLQLEGAKVRSYETGEVEAQVISSSSEPVKEEEVPKETDIKKIF